MTHYDAWGTSWWYFEVDDEGWVVRQVEQYDSGMLLRYSVQHKDDKFGAIAEKPLDLSEEEYSAISQKEFESVWQGL